MSVEATVNILNHVSESKCVHATMIVIYKSNVVS